MSDKTIKGLTKVLKDLEKFGDEVKTDVYKTTGSIATEIEADAKAFAPTNIGSLKGSITKVKSDEYGFKIAFYDDELNSWQEQDKLFKFRVDKNEH